MSNGDTFEFISDGTPKGTHVYYGDTELRGVKEVTININPETLARAVVTIDKSNFNWEILPSQVVVVVGDQLGEKILLGFFEALKDVPEADGAEPLRDMIREWKNQHDEVRIRQSQERS